MNVELSKPTGMAVFSRCVAVVVSILVLALVAGAVSTVEAQGKIVFKTYTWQSKLDRVQIVNPFMPNFWWDPVYLVYHVLAYYDYRDSKPIPALAIKWEWVDDKTLKIYLRKGVTWSDGTPFTAKDVWTQIVLIKAFGWREYSNIADAIVVDEHTILVIYENRTLFDLYHILSKFPIMLPYKIWGSFAEEIYEAMKEGNLTKVAELCDKVRKYKPSHVLALGPYVPGIPTPNTFPFEKNPRYWNKSLLPYLPDEVVFMTVRDNQQVWLMMKGGGIDYANIVVSPHQEEELSVGGAGKIVFKKPHSGFAIYFNMQNKWLADVDVRRAIAYVLDRTIIARAAYPNIHIPVQYPDGLHDWMRMRWLNKSVISMLDPYKRDLRKAEEILESKGFRKIGGKWFTPDGEPFKLRLIAPSGWTDWVQAMQAVAELLSNFGIEVDYRTPDLTTYWRIWDSKQWDLAINWWGCYHLMHPYWSYAQWIDRFESLGFNTTFYVPGIGWINASKVLRQLLYAVNDVEEQKRLVALLALVTDKALPIYIIAEKRMPHWVSNNFVWPGSSSWIWWVWQHGEIVAFALEAGLVIPKYVSISNTAKPSTSPSTSITQPPTQATSTSPSSSKQSVAVSATTSSPVSHAATGGISMTIVAAIAILVVAIAVAIAILKKR